MAAANPFRFSTKFQDDETGLLYYGYRYYDPSTGRWNSRDPIDENGGLNLHGASKNDMCNRYDVLGFFSFDVDYRLNHPANSPVWGSPLFEALTQVTDKSYKTTQTRGECVTYNVEVKAGYVMYFKFDPSEKTHTGITVQTHEDQHVSHHNAPLMEFEKAFNGFKICCKPGYCISEFSYWMSSAFEVAKLQGAYDSVGFDLNGEYPPDSPGLPGRRRQQAEILEELNKAKVTEATAKQRFEACVKAHPKPKKGK